MNKTDKIREGQTQIDDKNNYSPLTEPMVKETQSKVLRLITNLGCQSFRLQVDSPTSRSFRLHDQVVSPTLKSFRLHLWVEIFFEDRWKSLLVVNKEFVFDRISS